MRDPASQRHATFPVASSFQTLLAHLSVPSAAALALPHAPPQLPVRVVLLVAVMGVAASVVGAAAALVVVMMLAVLLLLLLLQLLLLLLLRLIVARAHVGGGHGRRG